MGGVLYPDNSDYKTGGLVMDVMRDKNPDLFTTDLANLTCTFFEEYKEYPEVLPMDIYEDAIQWVDTRLSGSDRPSRTDVPAFQRWLL